MKGDKVLLNGDIWVIVDDAPAHELAEMVAVILEEEGFLVQVRGEGMSDIFTVMGTSGLGTTYVLVPEKDEQKALDLIAETVTDYEGDDLDNLLEQLALEGTADTAAEDSEEE